MALYEDAAPILDEFGQWLDGTFKGQSGYLSRPSTEAVCNDFDCPSQIRLGGLMGEMVYGQEGLALRGPVGEAFTAQQLDVYLIRHARACGGLILARVTRASETATRLSLAPETVQVISKTRTLVLGNFEKDFPLTATHETDSFTTFALPGARCKTGTPQRYDLHLSDPADVGAFLGLMKDEITEHLETSVSRPW